MERRGGDEQQQEDLAKKLIIKGNRMLLSLTYCLGFLDTYGKGSFPLIIH